MLGIRLGLDKQEAGNSILAMFPTFSPGNLLLAGVREKTVVDGLSDLAGIYVLQHKLICETNCGCIDDTPMEKIALRGSAVHTCLWYWINQWSIIYLGVGVPLLICFASRLCYRQL